MGVTTMSLCVLLGGTCRRHREELAALGSSHRSHLSVLEQQEGAVRCQEVRA